MAIRVLSNPNAFSTGAQLWVTPAPDQSDWTKRIDWYLNLQIRRAERHQSLSLSNDLIDILDRNELPNFHRSGDNESSPLLISCENQLPVSGVARMKLTTDFANWIGRIKELWVNLNKPQIRIFLPESFGIEDVKKYWDESDEHLISIVPHSSVLT